MAGNSRVLARPAFQRKTPLPYGGGVFACLALTCLAALSARACRAAQRVRVRRACPWVRERLRVRELLSGLAFLSCFTLLSLGLSFPLSRE